MTIDAYKFSFFQEQSPNGIIYLHVLLMNKQLIVLNNLCISISTYS